MSEAWTVLTKEYQLRPNLHILGISGPGEPLFNEQTYQLMDRVQTEELDLRICISTNGILLAERVGDLVQLGVDAISVSINTTSPMVATSIYRQVFLHDEFLRGAEIGELIIDRQLKGLRKASNLGIPVKVNTILIPGMNDKEIDAIAQTVAAHGASLHNIMPLVPRGAMKQYDRPSQGQIANARKVASKYVRQFAHCKQCRSDVVGIPGDDALIHQTE